MSLYYAELNKARQVSIFPVFRQNYLHLPNICRCRFQNDSLNRSVDFFSIFILALFLSYMHTRLWFLKYSRIAVMNGERVKNLAQTVSVEFHKYSPSPWLKPYVRNFWMLRYSGSPASPRWHRIVPDGCIDLIFMRRDPTEDYRASVVGTMTRPIVEELASHADYLGIRFNPGGFRRFFQTPPRELTDRIFSLDDLSSPSWFAEGLSDDRDLTACLESLEDELTRRFRPEKRDLLPAAVLETITTRRGNVSMTQLGRMTGWSPRHLRRMFHESIGIGPKIFCRIIRFLDAYRVLRRSPRPSFLDVALDAGYYDQAHFIREFEDFYGSSPSTISENSAF
jgi:AraC-like DNA-binding protein